MSRKTGVIVGLEQFTTAEDAERCAEQLSERFPHVRFVVMTGATSVAFEWEEEATP